jgi:hypothetical protein
VDEYIAESAAPSVDPFSLLRWLENGWEIETSMASSRCATDMVVLCKEGSMRVINCAVR